MHSLIRHGERGEKDSKFPILLLYFEGITTDTVLSSKDELDDGH